MAPVPGGLTVNGAAGKARLAADGGMNLDVKGLPAPPGQDFYEVWLFDPPSGRMLAVGVLPPTGKGSYSLPASLEDSYSAVEISLEPNDGNPAHSKVSVLRGPLA
jgi:anti-sigma-K factor RskA